MTFSLIPREMKFFGVGTMQRVNSVRWGVAQEVVLAWIFTIPASAAISAISWWLLGTVG